jgi:hypothetical protein
MITPLPPSTPVFTLPPPPPVTTAPSTALPAGASAAAPSTGVLRRIYQALIGLLCLVAGFLLVAVFVVVRKYWKPQLSKWSPVQPNSFLSILRICFPFMA